MQSRRKDSIESTSSPSKIEGAGGSMTTHTHNAPELKPFRRALRNNSTEAEKALWNWLKGNKIEGLRFRRQYSIDNHILDFYCPKLRLAIELDGEYHYHGNMLTADYERDAYLFEKYGIRTLRFENHIVFEQPYTIINAIKLTKSEKENRVTQ